MLECFLFLTYLYGILFGKLFGGERRCLYLLCILMGELNVFLFDEFMNDLDI